MSPLLYNDDEDVANKFDEPVRIRRQTRAVFVDDSFVRVNPIKKNEAPLGKTNFTVMLELTGLGSTIDRHGVDIVTVLDVSYSMKGKKLEQLKTAMLFLISKLSSIDRLSIVTFSDDSERLCPLLKITEASTKKLGDLVNNLVPINNTNIAAGLETALKVINERRVTMGRLVAIMLMSDGVRNRGGDPTRAAVRDVPVYTFGFSAGVGGVYDPVVLQAIANNSKGGTFAIADTEDAVGSNLCVVFSQCLAGLLTTVVRNLKLKVRQVKKSKIVRVNAGNYPQRNDNAEGSVTIVFCALSIQEKRIVTVDLELPPFDQDGTSDILEFSYSYNTNDGSFDSGPRNIRIKRVGRTVEQEIPNVMVEQTRLETKSVISKARALAEVNKLQDAKGMLNDAYCSLEDVFDDEADQKFEMMRRELQQLSKLMESPQMYNTHGRSFALASETSHDRQRFAARGDAAQLRLYSTPQMDEFLKEAKSFQDKHRSVR